MAWIRAHRLESALLLPGHIALIRLPVSIGVLAAPQEQPPILRLHGSEEPLRLVEQAVAKDDPDPKALARYGLLVRFADGQSEEVWLQFVGGRPVSSITPSRVEQVRRDR